MILPRVMLACALSLAVAACGIPDIVAHGVKEFDKTQRKGEIQPAAAPTRQPAVQPAVAAEEPPPPYSGPSAPAVRDSVTVETLPPPR